jgi:hypothetical protein
MTIEIASNAWQIQAEDRYISTDLIPLQQVLISSFSTKVIPFLADARARFPFII